MTLFSPSEQLTLPVYLNQDASFANFYGVENQQALTLLKGGLEKHHETLMYVSGPAGHGKTHLLFAAMSYIETQNRSVCYFSMSDFFENEVLTEDIQNFFLELANYSLVILDNVDALFSRQEPVNEHDLIKEKCLFNLFNQIKISGQQLLLGSRTPPSLLAISLPDLKSRLQSGLLITLSEIKDEQKQALMKAIAKEKGLELDEDVSSYIITRSGRDLGSLVMVLKILDQASLSEQRKLTVPFVKKTLNW